MKKNQPKRKIWVGHARKTGFVFVFVFVFVFFFRGLIYVFFLAENSSKVKLQMSLFLINTKDLCDKRQFHNVNSNKYFFLTNIFTDFV